MEGLVEDNAMHFNERDRQVVAGHHNKPLYVTVSILDVELRRDDDRCRLLAKYHPSVYTRGCKSHSRQKSQPAYRGVSI